MTQEMSSFVTQVVSGRLGVKTRVKDRLRSSEMIAASWLWSHFTGQEYTPERDVRGPDATDYSFLTQGDIIKRTGKVTQDLITHVNS